MLSRYDLLDVCVNGPKEKLDSTVISQVHLGLFCLCSVGTCADGGFYALDVFEWIRSFSLMMILVYVWSLMSSLFEACSLLIFFTKVKDICSNICVIYVACHIRCKSRCRGSFKGSGRWTSHHRLCWRHLWLEPGRIHSSSFCWSIQVDIIGLEFLLCSLQINIHFSFLLSFSYSSVQYEWKESLFISSRDFSLALNRASLFTK